MGLDLGNLRLGIQVDTKEFDSKMRAVDQSAKTLKKGLENAGKTKIDVNAQGKEKLDDATKSAEKLAAAMRKARDEGNQPVKSPISPEEIDRSTSALNRLGTTAKTALGFAATTAGITGVGAAFQATLTAGNDFTNNMNTLAAVSGATAQQLEAAGARARQLGNDVSLPATSAGDAAMAMSELAKGGFTVEQAMSAAKGTLQLAAAAQIDGAAAATIQSQALQSFRLGAEDAARVSDILAGGANASSAEIQGIAHGLQQAGTVANGFGVSIEDTVTALAMFANAGIQGSDAGTLLKTSLLAITDQGKPAQAAIEELGLTLYDAERKFVGLPAMFEQLAEAQSRMTDEQFQAATSTLFGSDAIRQAMVAAEQGGQGFEKLRTAVTRQGQAAEVAAAKTQGLPGAISSVSNAAEELGLKLYDLYKGPAEQGLRGVADGLTYIGDNAHRIPWEAWGAGLALVASKTTGVSQALSRGTSAITRFSQESRAAQLEALKQGQSMSRLAAASQQLATISPVYDRMRTSYQNAGTGLRAFADKHRDAALAAKHAASESKTAFDAIDRMGSQAAHSFAANTARMGRAATGLASGGFSLLKSSASGLMGALGGPWGLAITAAGLALGHLAQEQANAAAAAEEHKAYQDSLRSSLNATTGAVTEQTRALQREKAQKEGYLDIARELGLAESTVIDAMNGSKTAITEVDLAIAGQSAKLIEGTEYWKKWGKELQAVGVTSKDVAGWLSGTDSAGAKLRDRTRGFDASHGNDVRALKEEMDGATDSAFKLEAGIKGTSDALAEQQQRVAENSVKELEKQMETTRQVTDLLGDAIIAIPDNKTIKVAADAVTDDTIKKVEEIGGIVERGIDGTISFAFPNGLNIIQLLDEMGAKIDLLPTGEIVIQNATPEVMDFVQSLGIAVESLPDGNAKIDTNAPGVIDYMVELGILVRSPLTGQVTIADNVDAALARIRSLDGQNTSSTHTITTVEQRVQYWTSIGKPRAGAEKIQGPIPINKADGGIVHFANGGEFHEAEIARPGTIRVWNEPETQGEAYIPLALSKRPRSERILTEVARRFGKTVLDQDALQFANGGIIGGITGAFNNLWGSQVHGGLTLGEIVLRADEDTKRAFDELERATEDRAAAAERVAEAERALAEARADEKADPKKIEKAEKALEKARKDEVEATEKATEAARRHAEAQRLAPFKVAQDVFSGLGEVFNALSSVVDKMAERARKQVEEQRKAIAIAGEAADAQLRLQDAMLAAAEASRDVANQRWRDDMAVSDAEWALSMARKRGQIEVAKAARYAGDVQAVQARTTRETATLEAAVALAKAQRDLAAFERAEQLKLSSIELEHAQKLTEIQTQKLALSSLALAQAQNGLYGSNASALEATSQKLQGAGSILGGIGGIAGGIAGILGAVGMAATNPLGALVAGLGALPGLLGGIGGIIGGAGQIKDARQSQNNGSAEALAALEHKEQQAELEFKKARLEANKSSLAQRELLSKLVDNAEKALALAQQKEKREKDLEDLFNASENDGASVFFQLGGSGWGGEIATMRDLPRTISGFGGVAGSRAEHDASWRVEGQETRRERESKRFADQLSRTPSPQVAGAAAAISTAQNTNAIKVSINTLVGLTQRLVRAAEAPDRDARGETIGTVFNGPVTITDPHAVTPNSSQDSRLAAALAVRP